MITDYQANLTQNGNALNTAVKDYDEDADSKSGQAGEEKASVLDNWQNRFGISSKRISVSGSNERTLTEVRDATIKYIFELLFSARKSRFNDWTASQNFSNQGQNTVSGSGQNAGNGQMLTGSTNLNFLSGNLKTLNYSQESFYEESESTSFSTVGTVRTADGREINFNVEVGMSRSFQEYYREDLELASFTMCDPLVINLNNNVAELSDQKFFFDIDADGEKDEISQLGSGSGYLALDKNGDGVINDGSELFGTASGDGFADLAKYDEDGNGWIDENDPIWSKLKIWCKDENGNDVLYKLADKGVGAICLQKAATDFTLQGDAGQTKGAIRSTGVFLYENGSAGTIQHVDVAKYSKEA